MEESRGLAALLPFWLLIAPVAWALMTMPKAGERSARSMAEERNRSMGMAGTAVR